MSAAKEIDNEKVVIVDTELEEIVPKFLENLVLQVDEMAEAIKVKDITTLQRVAHTLKGVCGGYGFDELGEYAKQIDAIVREERYEGTEELVERMKVFMRTMKVVFKSEE